MCIIQRSQPSLDMETYCPAVAGPGMMVSLHTAAPEEDVAGAESLKLSKRDEEATCPTSEEEDGEDEEEDEVEEEDEEEETDKILPISVMILVRARSLKSALSTVQNAQLLKERPHVFPYDRYIVAARYAGSGKRSIRDGDYSALLMKLCMSDVFTMTGDIQDNCDKEVFPEVSKLFTDLRPVKNPFNNFVLVVDSSSGKSKHLTHSLSGFYRSPAYRYSAGAAIPSLRAAKLKLEKPIFMQSYDGFCAIQAIWDLHLAYPLNVMRVEQLAACFGDENYKLTSRAQANILFNHHIKPKVLTVSQGATTDLLRLEEGVFLAEANQHWFFINKNKIKFVSEWLDLNPETIARHGWIFTRVLKVDVDQALLPNRSLAVYFFNSKQVSDYSGARQVFKARKRPAQTATSMLPAFYKKPCV